MTKRKPSDSQPLTVTQVPLAQLNPAPYNPRTISAEDMANLKRSIETFGFVENVVANKDGTVISGHKRLAAARDLGLDTVPVCFVDLTKDLEKALNVAMNRISGEFDMKLLPELIASLPAEMQQLTGFSDEEVTKMLDDVATGLTGEGTGDGEARTYEVVVTCKHERDQQETMENLKELGYNCRTITL